MKREDNSGLAKGHLRVVLKMRPASILCTITSPYLAIYPPTSTYSYLTFSLLLEATQPITAFMDGHNIDRHGVNLMDKAPQYGDTAHLRCDSSGFPIPTISWYRNGVKIPTKSLRMTIKVCTLPALLYNIDLSS